MIVPVRCFSCTAHCLSRPLKRLRADTAYPLAGGKVVGDRWTAYLQLLEAGHNEG